MDQKLRPPIIQKIFRLVLSEVIETFKFKFPKNLHSIYVYGSVAKGAAQVGISDLDLCIIFNEQLEDQDQIIAEIQDKLLQKYPFLPKIDFDIGLLCDVLSQQNRNSWGAWIKFFCTHIYGEDLRSYFKEVEINLQVIKAINQDYAKEVAHYFDALRQNTKNAKEMFNLKKSLIKRMIRLLPLTQVTITAWPLSLSETIQQAIDAYPEQQNDFQYLLSQLESPQLPDSILIKNLSDIYLWIENRLS